MTATKAGLGQQPIFLFFPSVSLLNLPPIGSSPRIWLLTLGGGKEPSTGLNLSYGLECPLSIAIF